MNPILLALSPFFVQFVTAILKKLPLFQNLSEGWYKTAVRFLVALLSFGAAVGGSWLSGGDVDPLALETFVNAFVAFLSATGSHFLMSKK